MIKRLRKEAACYRTFIQLLYTLLSSTAEEPLDIHPHGGISFLNFRHEKTILQ